MTIKNKKSICIVSPNAYGLISGNKKGFVGGVEWQTSMMARWLVENGFEVTLITWAVDSTEDEFYDGVRVIKICNPKAGLPWVRFFHPKWTGLIKALKKADADLYYHNCSEAETGQMVLWCKQNKKPSIFSTASNADCEKPLKKFKDIRERILYKYGLTHADRIVVQTKFQGESLLQNYGLKTIHIPMPSVNPSDGAACRAENIESNRILWIGRICRDKRLDRLIPVAEKLSQFQFDVVGPIPQTQTNLELVRRLEYLPNVKVHGLVPKEFVPAYFKAAKMLLCTSENEGFPNTFLEAWSYGVPVVTTFDPDKIVTLNCLGITADNPEEIVSGIQKIMNDISFYREASKNAREYFLANHTTNAVLPRFAEFFRETVALYHDS